VLLVCRWRKDSGAARVKSPSFLFRELFSVPSLAIFV
jgi:hypothetical protein